jgi:hypothetical protein
LTRIAFLASTSHRGATSPPIRANAVSMRLLCRVPTEPPAGVDTTPPAPVEGEGPKTNRTLFEERTASVSCQGCHTPLNGLGFGFEHYDAAGGYTQLDHGLPVNATGMLLGTDVDGPFYGAVELSQRLSESKVVHDCAVHSWMRYILGREPSEHESALVEALSARSLEDGGQLLDLLTSITTSNTFRMLPVSEEP